jgi:uncharacterized membrane protein YhhN
MLAPILVCGTAVVCLLAAEWADVAIARIAAKMAAASSFVALALARNALDSEYGLVVLAGLVLCWIGDACLLPAGRSRAFLAGIAAFLLGHVAYAVAFARLGLDGPGLAVGVALVAVFAVVTLRWLWPHLPADFRWPVVAYLVVISAMVATAIGSARAGAPWTLAAGAVVFAFSDLFVARDRFVREGFLNAAIGLPAYFGAQLLIAASVGDVAVAALAR